MFYIFDKDEHCIASCSVKPSQKDLDLRGETYKESTTVIPLYISLL